MSNEQDNTSTEQLFNSWLEKLRRKWSEIPGGGEDRLRSPALLQMPAEELHRAWLDNLKLDVTGDRFAVRGWYHALYADAWRDKKLLDVGSGFGMDALSFARAGAQVTCLDIVPDNLAVLRKLAGHMGLANVEFVLLEDFATLKRLPKDFDVIWAQGSLINAPFEVTRSEVQELIRHLKSGGRFVELAYPRVRWERDGCMPFETWGEKTDGGAPWMEWYDLEKVKALLAPQEFNVVLNLEFHNSDFNWFDLQKA